jgi:hypothetical protein
MFPLTKEQREANERQQEAMFAGCDIGFWYRLQMKRVGVCPNCGMDFKTSHPAHNLFPHWIGQCKVKPLAPYDYRAELRKHREIRVNWVFIAVVLGTLACDVLFVLYAVPWIAKAWKR